jgi:hypothetical protein
MACHSTGMACTASSMTSSVNAGLQPLGFLAVRGALEGGEHPLVEVGLVHLAGGRVRIAIGEDLEARLVLPEAGHHETVPGARTPCPDPRAEASTRLPGETRPAPLLVVAVVVADEEVEDAGAEEGARVGPVLRIVKPACPQGRAVHDLGGAEEGGPRPFGHPRYSSIVPIRLAKVVRNAPSAGSSGMTTSRTGGVMTPAAAARRARTTPAAGWVHAVRSRISCDVQP